VSGSLTGHAVADTTQTSERTTSFDQSREGGQAGREGADEGWKI